jgi:hypothetical protein
VSEERRAVQVELLELSAKFALRNVHPEPGFGNAQENEEWLISMHRPR